MSRLRNERIKPHKMSWALCFVAGSSLLGGGCEDLSQELMKDAGSANPDATMSSGQMSRVRNTAERDGVIVSEVDAWAQSAWVYFRFGEDKEVTPKDPQNSIEWDLALQRFQINVNGGVSGPGGVEIALPAGATFDALIQAPRSGYVTDAKDGPDADIEPDDAFEQNGTWYSYNPMTHILSAKDQVYVVRATTGKYYKMQMTGYYDKAGSAGHPTFRWKQITAP